MVSRQCEILTLVEFLENEEDVAGTRCFCNRKLLSMFHIGKCCILLSSIFAKMATFDNFMTRSDVLVGRAMHVHFLFSEQRLYLKLWRILLFWRSILH